MRPHVCRSARCTSSLANLVVVYLHCRVSGAPRASLLCGREGRTGHLDVARIPRCLWVSSLAHLVARTAPFRLLFARAPFRSQTFSLAHRCRSAPGLQESLSGTSESSLLRPHVCRGSARCTSSLSNLVARVACACTSSLTNLVDSAAPGARLCTAPAL